MIIFFLFMFALLTGAALAAGLFGERFDIVSPGASGCGGATIYRYQSFGNVYGWSTSPANEVLGLIRRRTLAGRGTEKQNLVDFLNMIYFGTSVSEEQKKFFYSNPCYPAFDKYYGGLTAMMPWIKRSRQ